MTATREDVFGALFTLGSAITWTSPYTGGAFIEKSRRVKLFSDVASNLQPAFFQAEHGEELTSQSGLPYKQVWDAQWVIYQCVGNSDSAIGAIENNLILDAVVAALQPPPADPGFRQNRLTLNRLVYHCFINGKVFKDPGDIDRQGMMTIPIRMLVP